MYQFEGFNIVINRESATLTQNTQDAQPVQLEHEITTNTYTRFGNGGLDFIQNVYLFYGNSTYENGTRQYYFVFVKTNENDAVVVTDQDNTYMLKRGLDPAYPNLYKVTPDGQRIDRLPRRESNASDMTSYKLTNITQVGL